MLIGAELREFGNIVCAELHKQKALESTDVFIHGVHYVLKYIDLIGYENSDGTPKGDMIFDVVRVIDATHMCYVLQNVRPRDKGWTDVDFSYPYLVAKKNVVKSDWVHIENQEIALSVDDIGQLQLIKKALKEYATNIDQLLYLDDATIKNDKYAINSIIYNINNTAIHSDGDA